MAITSAVQKGSIVYVYDGNRQLFTKTGFLLQGYTATTVSMKSSNGKHLYTFDDKGRQLSCKSV